MQSVYSEGFLATLQQAGLSVFLTMPLCGIVAVLRADGDCLNTHLAEFRKPTGLAVQNDRMVLATLNQVVEFRNVPDACNRLTEHRDACFLPRSSSWTGNVLSHELGIAGDDVVFVNTQFSCVARRSSRFNFVPIWMPPFLTRSIPGDCCHLNGLALRDGAPRYATALGESDIPGGWRENAIDGGVVIDIQANEVLSRGLSMPHSPRWHNNELWLLQSGTGGLGKIDLRSGGYEEMIRLPGFTRGLSFHGNLAFVGVSSVRDRAYFGAALKNGESMNRCGVWIIEATSATVLGMLEFVNPDELFAVEVLSGVKSPEIINMDNTLIDSVFQFPANSTLVGVG